MAKPRNRDPDGAETPYNPDEELVRSFGIGCGVLFLVFLCGWATIAWFWLR